VLALSSACAQPAPPTADPAPSDTWEEIVAQADGQTVNWYMWGGQENINQWVTGYVAETIKAEYNITLNMVPVVDTADVVNKVLGEKQAGQDTSGSVDLIWINGENFRTMRQADLLFGPWAERLPNRQYINTADASVNNDMGYPVEGYESPYGKAQFVLVYDSARVPQSPHHHPRPHRWIKANPGQFTYPAPPDFTGLAFVMQMCYHALGGYEPFLADFDQAVFDDHGPPAGICSTR
jgi:putative spermidine/putrescine transport system substrate-binding protein